MTMPKVLYQVDEIFGLLKDRGAEQYGREAVTQLDHALQCAYLAEQQGETRATITAALLHDIGHLVREAGLASDPERDDLHQFIALPFLRGLFDDAVLQPIRLHVDAKRYLCQAEAGYFETLSPASVQSLKVQGGVFDERQAAAFLRQPFAAEAVRLRRYDDLAKVPGVQVPDVAYFESVARAVAI
jgi:phosphonate degradation associated HDIG domain protein